MPTTVISITEFPTTSITVYSDTWSCISACLSVRQFCTDVQLQHYEDVDTFSVYRVILVFLTKYNLSNSDMDFRIFNVRIVCLFVCFVVVLFLHEYAAHGGLRRVESYLNDC